MSGELGLVAEWSRVNRLSKPSLQEMLVWFSTDPRSGLWASQLVVMGTSRRNTSGFATGAPEWSSKPITTQLMLSSHAG